MNKLNVLAFVLLLGGCADSSLIVPVGGSVVVEDEEGNTVRRCQVVLENGIPNM